MSYFGELRTNWRFLAAAAVGMGSGYMLSLYMNNLFSSHLLKEFGWSKSQFALMGMISLVSLVSLPIAGRLVDIFGVRRMATVGVIACPLILVALSAIDGDFYVYFLLNVLQIAVVGALTASTVYSRLIAEQFDRTRGLALAIAACGPALMAAIASPLLTIVIDSYGWRAGYLAWAAGTAVTGSIALLLIPRRSGDFYRRAGSAGHSTAGDYREILGDPTFRIIAGGMWLCNLNVMVMSSQLKLILLEREMLSSLASQMISLFAIGIAIGRLSCGIALDRYPTWLVSAICFGLPGIGFLMLASGATSFWLLAGAVFLIGFCVGADADVTAYLVMRYFKVRVYSTVYALVTAVIAFAAAAGAMLLSLTLKVSDGFGLHLYLSAFAALAGSALFLLLRRFPPVERDVPVEDGAPPPPPPPPPAAAPLVVAPSL